MKRSPNKAMAPCVQRATVYALWGMLLLALPQFARASALAPAGFGLSGFSPTRHVAYRLSSRHDDRRFGRASTSACAR